MHQTSQQSSSIHTRSSASARPARPGCKVPDCKVPSPPYSTVGDGWVIRTVSHQVRNTTRARICPQRVRRSALEPTQLKLDLDIPTHPANDTARSQSNTSLRTRRPLTTLRTRGLVRMCHARRTTLPISLSPVHEHLRAKLLTGSKESSGQRGPLIHPIPA